MSICICKNLPLCLFKGYFSQVGQQVRCGRGMDVNSNVQRYPFRYPERVRHPAIGDRYAMGRMLAATAFCPKGTMYLKGTMYPGGMISYGQRGGYPRDRLCPRGRPRADLSERLRSKAPTHRPPQADPCTDTFLGRALTDVLSMCDQLRPVTIKGPAALFQNNETRCSA